MISYLTWISGDSGNAAETQKVLQEKGFTAWVHPPTQPEERWMVPVSHETWEAGTAEAVLDSIKEKQELWYEGPYDQPMFAPSKCASCGGDTQYEFRSLWMDDPYSTDIKTQTNFSEDGDHEYENVRIEVGPWVKLCFPCAPAFLNDTDTMRYSCGSQVHIIGE